MPIQEPEPDEAKQVEAQKWLQELKIKTATAEAALEKALADGNTTDAMLIVGTIAYGRCHMLEVEVKKLTGRVTELEEKLKMYESDDA